MTAAHNSSFQVSSSDVDMFWILLENWIRVGPQAAAVQSQT